MGTIWVSIHIISLKPLEKYKKTEQLDLNVCIPEVPVPQGHVF